MVQMIDAAKAAVSKELQRFRNRRFLEAAMASSALLALADDEIRLSERLALDFVLENMNELKIFDAHKAVDLFRHYAEAIQENLDTGKEEVFAAVSRFANDSTNAELLIRACVCIAKADGAFSDEERGVVAELCTILKLDAAKLGM